MLLTAVLPICALGAASAWSKQGLDLELTYLPYAAFIPLALTTIPAFGLRGRRFWAIAYYWTLAAAIGLLYPIVLVFASLVPLGIMPNRSSDGAVLVAYPFGFLLFASPLYYFLLRFLRIRYWRPWTDRSTWEPGDEVAPEWAKTVTGIMSPSARAHWAAQKSKAGKPAATKKQVARSPAKKRR